jgi:hypothetical protein
MTHEFIGSTANCVPTCKLCARIAAASLPSDDINASAQAFVELLESTKPPTRIKRITSHAGLFRFLGTLRPMSLMIPRISTIPSPYAYSPTHVVHADVDDRLVFVVETAHKRYDVFLVPDSSKLGPEEA